MGDRNQFRFIQRHDDLLVPPYLEVGSKNYGTTQDLRALFASRGKYVGIDREAGEGVDVILDLTHSFDDVDAALQGERFGTIFCLSVLEHCEQPFRMAANLTSLLKPGGRIYISVPFAWKFHGYPSDYWRFTHEGVKKLFPELAFPAQLGVAARPSTDDFSPLDPNIGKISLSPGYYRKQGRPFRGFSASLFRSLSKFGLFKWLTGYRYVMAPTSVFMIGTRETDAGIEPTTRAA